MEYIVITSVPGGDKVDGNLATALGQIYLENGQQVGIESLALRVRVFEPGEILICNGGREVAGKGRKPSKWFIEYEEFDNINDAVQRAVAITYNEGA